MKNRELKQMDDLKRFYEEVVRAKSPNLPEFSKASPEVLKSVSKSITFAAWKLSQATKGFKEACKKFNKACNLNQKK